ncbi:hypothetical protein GGI07_004718 [Coemansia sp. Benny D115]|nr:hypothetical protein GGI07_004718 [Coemansia sp. Benny D115]
MSVQLTTDLLSAFIRNASIKNNHTLQTSNELTASVFGDVAQFWLVPSEVNHPLRPALGLSIPFILVTGNASSKKISLYPTQNVFCGAEPLTTWPALVRNHGDDNSLRRADTKDIEAGEMILASYEYEWGVQRLEPLERNRARGLAAQYAQILPTLDQGAVLPMLIFVRAMDGNLFYLAIAEPQTQGGFAQVLAVRDTGKQSAPISMPLASDCIGGQIQQTHWAEYDLLGSPTQLDASQTETELSAEIGDLGLNDKTESSVVPMTESPMSSFAVLRGVWQRDCSDTDECMVLVPPKPPLSTHWILELASVPLEREPGAERKLRRLLSDIRRLEIWTQALQQPDSSWHQIPDQPNGSTDAEKPILHIWQGIGVYSDSGDESDDTEEEHTSSERPQTLAQHRVWFGDRIDGFCRRTQTSDLCDALWDLAGDAQDADDLAECLAATAECVETGKMMVRVRVTNESQIANALRQAAKCQGTSPLDEWMQGTRLLEAFVSMGEQKLRADFRRLLADSRGLAPAHQVDLLSATRDGLRLLLRALEVAELVRLAAPALPLAFTAQAVQAVLESSVDISQGILRVCICLPAYSREGADFARAAGDSVDGPTRYAVVADNRLVYMTRTPGLIDQQYTLVNDSIDNDIEDSAFYSIFTSSF